MQVMLLGSLASQLDPPSIAGLGWSHKVFCTANFAMAVIIQYEGTALNDYMRFPGAALLFPASGELLLVSEREADALLASAWSFASSNTAVVSGRCPVLMMDCYPESRGNQLPFLAVPLKNPSGSGWREYVRMGSPELVSVRLWGGETHYGGQSSNNPLLNALVQLLCKGGKSVAKHAAAAMVDMRGKQAMLACSDLEQAWKAVATS
jgi:hypothetical protein